MSAGIEPDVYREVARTARKPHRCCECRSEIAPGERYVVCSGVWDGRGESWPTCSTCAEVKTAWYAIARAEDMEPDDWSVGEMWEAIAFWIGERPCILADRARRLAL